MMNSKTTVALLFAMVSLGGMIAVPGLSTTAYAQIPDAGEIVDGVLDDIFGEEEEEETEDADNTQTIEQPIEQETNQEVDQSETNDQDNTNTQTQTGVIDQDIEQGLQDGDDSAESESESGDAKADKHGTASSSSSSGDASNDNQQGATNDARLQQLQVQNVDQDNFAEFGDDNADLDAANVAIPIAVPVNVDDEEEEVVEPEPDGADDLIPVCIGPSAQGSQQNAETLLVTEEQADFLEENLPSGQFERGACEEED
jgi:hypothetical protein